MPAMSFKIEHRIGIARPPAQVWAVLYDIDSWSAWNPMHPEASGKFLIDARLKLAEKVGDRTERYDAAVGDWVPGAQIVWVRRSHRGWVRHVRYLEIEPLSETGCIFAAGEMIEGRLAPLLISKARRKALKAANRGLGEAMKARVEAGFGEDTEAWRR
jgi:hypothetical protein